MMIRLFSITYLLLSLLTSQVFAGGLTSGLGGKKVRVVQNSAGRGQQRPQPSARQIVEIEDDAAEVATSSRRQNAIDAFLQSQRSAGSARRAPAQQQPRQNQRPHAQSTIGNNTDAELERAMELDDQDTEENEDQDSEESLLGTLGKAGLVAGLLFFGYKLFEMFNSGTQVLNTLNASVPVAPPVVPLAGGPAVPVAPVQTVAQTIPAIVGNVHAATANADAGITEFRAVVRDEVQPTLETLREGVTEATGLLAALRAWMPQLTALSTNANMMIADGRQMIGDGRGTLENVNQELAAVRAARQSAAARVEAAQQTRLGRTVGWFGRTFFGQGAAADQDPQEEAEPAHIEPENNAGPAQPVQLTVRQQIPNVILRHCQPANRGNLALTLGNLERHGNTRLSACGFTELEAVNLLANLNDLYTNDDFEVEISVGDLLAMSLNEIIDLYADDLDDDE